MLFVACRFCCMLLSGCIWWFAGCRLLLFADCFLFIGFIVDVAALAAWCHLSHTCNANRASLERVSQRRLGCVLDFGDCDLLVVRCSLGLTLTLCVVFQVGMFSVRCGTLALSIVVHEGIRANIAILCGTAPFLRVVYWLLFACSLSVVVSCWLALGR